MIRSLLGMINSCRSQLVMVVARIRIRETDPRGVAERDHIADTNGLLKEEDQTRKQNFRISPATKTQTDSQGRHQPLDVGPSDTPCY